MCIKSRKPQKEKLAKSSKKTIQNYFSIDIFHPCSIFWIYKYMGNKESNIWCTCLSKIVALKSCFNLSDSTMELCDEKQQKYF